MSDTLENQLQQILDIKNEIADTINAKGVNVQSSDPFSSYVRKIALIQGEGGSLNAFDIKITDHRLNEMECIGWGAAGSKIYKSEYPDFYNKCLEEYNNSTPTRQFLSDNGKLTLKGNLKHNRGVLSGFGTASDYAITNYNLPTTINSFELFGKLDLPDVMMNNGTLYGQTTSNNINPQISLHTTYGLSCYVGDTGTSWNILNTGMTGWDWRNRTVYTRLMWDGHTYKFGWSYDNKQWNYPIQVQCENAPCWKEKHLIGCEQSSKANITDATVKMHLEEMYIKINDEIVWEGCNVLNLPTNDNGHIFWDITDAELNSLVEQLYSNYNDIQWFGINTQEEYVMLPRPKMEQNKFIYYCLGNVVESDALIDLSKEIQLNNPFFFGQNLYTETDINNVSWLKSTGEFHSKELYPSMYQWILNNTNNNVKDFKAKNVQYDDYCFVVDQENETFRLPLLNGDEIFIYEKNSVSNVVQHDLPSGSSITFTAPCNGNLKLNVASGSTGKLYTTLLDCGVTVNGGVVAGGTQNSSLFMRRGQIAKLDVTTGDITLSSSIFAKAKGRGSLYFYVGETTSNANLIELGNITKALSDKVSVNSDLFDGNWVPQPIQLITTSSKSLVIDLSEYLPNDIYDYEVVFNIVASASSEVSGCLASDLFGADTSVVYRNVWLGGYARNVSTNVTVAVGAARSVTWRATSTAATCYISALRYRRLGKK